MLFDMRPSTPTSAPLVSVILVTWNSAKYLSRCLTSLAQQTFQDFETILVDNGSHDGALDGLQEKYSSLRLRIEQLDSNLGFAKANNIGARLACGRWLALLNTDAFPDPNWLESLIQATNEHPQYSCFSSRQIQANNPNFLDGAGDAYHVTGLAWKRYLGYPAKQFGLEEAEVFSPCGAAALYLRQAFLDVGGFDEDFFSYLEDVDLGFRLRLRGYRCLYVPSAIVHHIGSATLGVASDFALYHYHRNFNMVICSKYAIETVLEIPVYTYYRKYNIFSKLQLTRARQGIVESQNRCFERTQKGCAKTS